MTLLHLLRMASNVKKPTSTLRGRGSSTMIAQVEYGVANLRCVSVGPRMLSLLQSPPTRVSVIQSRFRSTSISEQSCYMNRTMRTSTTTPSWYCSVSTQRTPTTVSYWRRNYVALPSAFKEFLTFFTTEGFSRYMSGDDKTTTRSKWMRLLPFTKMGRNNADRSGSTADATPTSSLSAPRPLFYATTTTTERKTSMRDRNREFYNLSTEAPKVSTSTGASSSTKSMIMARRANIFLARVKRERSAIIKDVQRSIIGAAVHRRSTMARRRLAYRITMVRRANTLRKQATDAVSQVQVSTRNFIRFQNQKTLLHHNDPYNIKQEALGTQQQNDDIANDDYLLIHPNSKFDTEGFPLTSHVFISGKLTGDEIHYSSTEDENSKSRRYINPWNISSCQHEPFTNYLRWKLHQIFYTKDQTPESLQDFMERTATYISLDNNENIFSNQNLDKSFLANHYSPPPTTTTTHWNPSSTNNIENRIKCTWIGHSTCLVQMHGVTILTDPVFSDDIGPIAASHKRYVPPSHTIEELQNVVDGGLIDIVCLSHDHYDHLDYTSIHDLVKSSTVHVKKWCVPLGMKKWLLDNFGQQANCNQGIHEKDIYEMEWWDELVFGNSEPASNNRNTTVKVTCTPSQHWSCRTPFDRDIRLWCSWAVETISTTESRRSSNRLAFYFAGDTGVPRNGFPLHKQIGSRLGPFDLAALPIGAYLPRDFIGDSHINPMEARQLHLDLHATYSLAIHWGTFALGDEPFYEPPCLLRECFDNSTADGKDPFLVVRQGGYVLSDMSLNVANKAGEKLMMEDCADNGNIS